MIREDIYSYVRDRYGTKPVFPWKRDAESAVLKHKTNKKWYAVLMEIPGQRIGLDTESLVSVMNVKCEPDMVASLNHQSGFAPAYHMNKTHWLTIVLDGTVPMDTIFQLLDESFALTR